MKLILLRGLPGAGKSTFAHFIANIDIISNFHVVEADQYFSKNGKYKFVKLDIEKAHEYCQETTKMLLANKEDVIVSNTSTTEKEIKVYQDIAEEYGAEFISLIVENRHGNSSVHDVPDHVMINMKNRFVVKL